MCNQEKSIPGRTLNLLFELVVCLMFVRNGKEVVATVVRKMGC